jgi:hypothetical protein
MDLVAGRPGSAPPEEDLAGLELARLFYEEAVAPVLARTLPGLRHTAGRFGHGSDVLGLDDRISRDHGWGPRCDLLLEEAGFGEARAAVDAALRRELPPRFRGYSTRYRDHVRIDGDGPPSDDWVHGVEIGTVERFLRAELGVARATGWSAIDWLVVSEQRLLEVTGGALFRDDLSFADVRRRLTYFPDDVRLHLMAARWHKLGDEQAFLGRAGARGDEVGSALVGGRLAEGLMGLGFLLDRRYAPYSKWFGSAFARLPSAAATQAAITALVTARGWEERDRHWAEALRDTIALHEQAGLIAPGRYRPAAVYLGRPGSGLPQIEGEGGASIGRLVDELRDRIADPAVRALPRVLGSLDQISSCPDILYAPERRPALVALYGGRGDDTDRV